MAISELSFAKTWTSPADFPTVEPDEAKVRSDLQYHPDAIKKYLNERVVPLINDLLITKHSHWNKTVLDDITADKVAAWDRPPSCIVMIKGTWDADSQQVSFYDIPQDSTAYSVISEALETGKLPMLCITDMSAGWSAYYHLSRSDSTEYQFMSHERSMGGRFPQLDLIWITPTDAGYQSTPL